MSRFLLCVWWLSGGIFLSGCIDPYTPDVPPAEQANLVVDGFINPRGRTIIKLSRTFSVNTTNTAPAETRARMAIQDEAGQRYSLSETADGTYTSAALTLDSGRQYQLRITTAQGREYASDLVPAILTPPIDQLTWQQTPEEGAQVYLNTQDPTNASRYYRWEYEETWEFTAAFRSVVEYIAGANVLRPRRVPFYTCWRTQASVSILQSNTTQLSQNTIADYPLLKLPPTTKLLYGYSLLVRQYAQTSAEYAYWEQLRANTENLGTVNDPLPARVTGNVHALSDPAEVVLGYVGAHSVTDKRLFIDGAQFPTPRPGSVFFDPAYQSCLNTDSFSPLSAALQRLRMGGLIPVAPIIALTGDTTGATLSAPECADCRLRGTNVKPSFWP